MSDDMYDPFDEDVFTEMEEKGDKEMEFEDEEEEEDLEEQFREMRNDYEDLLEYTESLEDRVTDLQERHSHALDKLHEAGIAVVMADRFEQLNESEIEQVKENLLPKEKFDTPGAFKDHLDEVIAECQGGIVTEDTDTDEDGETLEESEDLYDPLGEAGSRSLNVFERIK